MNPISRFGAFAARHRLSAVWALLCALTLAGTQAARLGAVPALAVLALALAKAHLVAEHFMGLRRVCGPWRFLMALYLSGVGALVAYAFVSR